MREPSWLDLPVHVDERGRLGYLEAPLIPFRPQRVYYIFGVEPGSERGSHAHRTLQQVFVPVTGSVTLAIDDGLTSTDFLLDTPERGLFLPPGYWRTLHSWSKDAVLLVAASEVMDESDYIRNRQDYLTWVGCDSVL